MGTLSLMRRFEAIDIILMSEPYSCQISVSRNEAYEQLENSDAHVNRNHQALI